MENLIEIEELAVLVAKRIKIKFGLGSTLLIGKLKTWFKIIFDIKLTNGLRRFAYSLPNNDERCTILVILLENEWGAFYELLEQFCSIYGHGFGGFEKELRKNLEVWRKREIKGSPQVGTIIKDKEAGVGRIVKIMQVMACIEFVDGKEKRRKIEKLNIIS